MTDTLRTRIAYAIAQADGDLPGMEPDSWAYGLADTVIRELGQRRCERCRHYTPVDQFPLPYEGSDRMRPFCNTCTDYIEWATS